MIIIIRFIVIRVVLRQKQMYQNRETATATATIIYHRIYSSRTHSFQNRANSTN